MFSHFQCNPSLSFVWFCIYVFWHLPVIIFVVTPRHKNPLKRKCHVRKFLQNRCVMAYCCFKTRFPVHGIMSLSQWIAHWLNDNMPCAGKRVNDNMPCARQNNVELGYLVTVTGSMWQLQGQCCCYRVCMAVSEFTCMSHSFAKLLCVACTGQIYMKMWPWRKFFNQEAWDSLSIIRWQRQ